MKLTGNRNQCPTCGEYFNSNLAFDMHRFGVIGAFEPWLHRRCRTVEQMQEKGMLKNAAGFWITESRFPA